MRVVAIDEVAKLRRARLVEMIPGPEAENSKSDMMRQQSLEGINFDQLTIRS